MNALKQRAQAVLNDTSIDPQSRAIIRYALETNDPWLARLVRSADAAELPEPPNGGDDEHREKIEALAEIICGGGEGPAAALFVLMGTMQDSPEPRVIAKYSEALWFYSLRRAKRVRNCRRSDCSR